MHIDTNVWGSRGDMQYICCRTPTVLQCVKCLRLKYRNGCRGFHSCEDPLLWFSGVMTLE
jgi:hypothetical protein